MKTELTLNVLQTMNAQEYEDTRKDVSWTRILI